MQGLSVSFGRHVFYVEHPSIAVSYSGNSSCSIRSSLAGSINDPLRFDEMLSDDVIGVAMICTREKSNHFHSAIAVYDALILMLSLMLNADATISLGILIFIGSYLFEKPLWAAFEGAA